jgi:hypothetical protein
MQEAPPCATKGAKLMKSLILASAVLLAAATGAAAQVRQTGPSITLYEGPNYQGQARAFSTNVDNLADQGFNDRAQSARVQGVWRVCEDARMRGRCVEVSGDVPNLAALRLTAAVSSIEDLNRGRGAGGGFPGNAGPGVPPRGDDNRFRPDPRGFAGETLDGRTASFFPRPAAGPYRDAADFCRRLGFNGVIYADDRGQQLRDVVCRR